MNPQDPARLLHQSVQAHQQGRLDIAEASYRRAAELRLGWPEAHSNQSRLLRMLEQTEPSRHARP